MTANSAFSIFKEKYASDIRFWIILFFLLRLYGITDPPLEIAHNWRQVTSDMVARNFYEVDKNILYPRLDFAGDKSGISGTEFSVLNYAMYLLSLIFGFHDWFGRLINLVVSSYGIFYFYKLLKLKFDEKFSFYSAFVLLTSMWLMFSRKTMPDTFSTSLVIIGLYHASCYFEKAKMANAVFYFIFVTLGVLSKIPAAYLLAVLVFPMMDREVVLKRKGTITLISILACIPVVWWYFIWVPYLNERYEFPNYYMGTTISKGFHDIVNHLPETLEKFYFDALKFSGFIFCLTGFVLAIRKKEKKLLLTVLLLGAAFGVFMLKAGYNFYHHSYYIIPFVPVMSLLAAYAIMKIELLKLRIVLVLILVGESVGNQFHDFRIKDAEKYKLSLTEIAAKVSDPKDLIAINGDHNPQLIYFTHRRGWSISDAKTKDNTYMMQIVKAGCKYLFLDKHTKEFRGSLNDVPAIRFENKDFVVYQLQE